MAVENKIQTDYFKLYIDFENDLDLSSLTKILNALENINYNICLENNINYEDNKLKIRNVYNGSVWFEFTTLQGIVCSLIATLIVGTCKWIGLKKRLHSEKQLELFKKEITKIIEREIEYLQHRKNTENTRMEEYTNKLSKFLLFVENELVNLTMENLHPKRLKIIYYNILKKLKSLKESDSGFKEDIVEGLTDEIRKKFYDELVNASKFRNLVTKQRHEHDEYMENLLNQVDKLIDWGSSEEQEVEEKAMMKYEPESKSSQTAGELILGVCNDVNIKECLMKMVTIEGKEIKLEIKERVPDDPDEGPADAVISSILK